MYASLVKTVFLLLFVVFCYTEATPDGVPLSYVNNARSAGAVCLDGSLPGYHLRRSYGSKKWHLHLEGGGWCASPENCALRTQTNLGSSKYMQTTVPFTGLLSNNPQINPDFHDWNHVFLRYCDGASFSADAEKPLRLPSGKLLYFRGKRIFTAIIDELKRIGMQQAQQIFLSGCSAGGLAVIHRCNDLQSYFPSTKVKCLSDAGFFVNAPDTSGINSFYMYYNGIVNLHSLEKTLPSACITTRPAAECFFPQTMQTYVLPPVFIMNAAYDFWQLQFVEKISSEDYSSCVDNSTASCSGLNKMYDLRDKMIEALSYTRTKPSSGLFISSCFSHCQVGSDAWSKVHIDGKRAVEAVGDWYFDRQPAKHIERAYPRNKGCLKLQ